MKIHPRIILAARGATLFLVSVFYPKGGYSVKLKDTIGLGDTFAATVV